MNQHNQRIGGIAAIVEGILYIIGFVFLLTILGPAMEEGKSEMEKLSFLLENKTLFQVWNTLIYVVFGVVLIPLVLAINANFKSASLIGTKATPILGLIWSVLVIASGMIANVGLDSVSQLYVSDATNALTTWKTIEIIQNGLGGGVEIVGGLWVLLISLFGLREKVFPKAIHYLGLIVGSAGILTIVPGLKELGAVFGLTQIVWFIWFGIILLRIKE